MRIFIKGCKRWNILKVQCYWKKRIVERSVSCVVGNFTLTLYFQNKSTKAIETKAGVLEKTPRLNTNAIFDSYNLYSWTNHSTKSNFLLLESNVCFVIIYWRWIFNRSINSTDPMIKGRLVCQSGPRELYWERSELQINDIFFLVQ